MRPSKILPLLLVAGLVGCQDQPTAPDAVPQPAFDVSATSTGASGVLYGTNQSGRLYAIDPLTAAATFIGGGPAATENEFDTETGTLYSEGADGDRRLFTIDQSTGGVLGFVFHPIGALNGLEFVGGTLYGTFIDGPNRPSSLVTVDVSTGALTTIGPTGLGPITGLAYDGAAGVMYGSTSGAFGAADLVTIDLTTGAATVVGSMGINRVGSIEFLDGTLYAATSQRSSTPGRLYTVDTWTGAATLVAPISGLDRPSITGLTAAPCRRPTDPDDYGVFGSACYVSVRGPENGIESEQACVADFGGHLASIHSQAEDDFISALVDPGAAGGITAYIGGEAPGPSFLFLSGPSAAYLWTDGSPWDYENWRRTTGEPNGSGPAPAGVQFWPNTNFGLSGWNDVPKSAPLGGYVCKYVPRALPNLPPVADAGEDQTVECEGADGTEVTLDGSGSSDLDGTIVQYEWFDGATSLGTGVTLDHTFALGTHTVTLVVTDDRGATDSDDVDITVEDTTPPTVSMTVDPTSLWPPNHKMQLVASGISASDICCDVTLAVGVTSNEPVNGTGDGDTEPDWEVVDNGDGTYDVWVRAERAGTGTDRVYTITATATDCSNNVATASGTVTVPHDRGKGPK